MTNTLHRFGPAESFRDDYIVFAIASKGRNDDGALERYVRSLAGMKLKLLFEPGTSVSYSNMAYELLGDLIAKVSGKTFEDLRRGQYPQTARHEGQHSAAEQS